MGCGPYCGAIKTTASLGASGPLGLCCKEIDYTRRFAAGASPPLRTGDRAIVAIPQLCLRQSLRYFRSIPLRWRKPTAFARIQSQDMLFLGFRFLQSKPKEFVQPASMPALFGPNMAVVCYNFTPGRRPAISMPGGCRFNFYHWYWR
jgi:hypothetical protein